MHDVLFITAYTVLYFWSIFLDGCLYIREYFLYNVDFAF